MADTSWRVVQSELFSTFGHRNRLVFRALKFQLLRGSGILPGGRRQTGLLEHSFLLEEVLFFQYRYPLPRMLDIGRLLGWRMLDESSISRYRLGDQPQICRGLQQPRGGLSRQGPL